MGKYIPESEIVEQKEIIKRLIEELIEKTDIFTTNIDRIDETLVALKVCLNTTGGVRRLNELNNIEFDPVAITSAIDMLNEIEVIYKREKVDLYNIIVPKLS